MSKGWFKQGWADALKEKAKVEAIAQMRRERSAPRFFMKQGEKAKILFLDDEPFSVYEHRIEINGRWEPFVCIKEIDVCPICNAFPRSRPQYVCYFSILDLRSYTTADGKQVKYSKKLYGAKSSMPGILHDLAKKHKGLRGCLCEVKRYGDKAPNTGDYIQVSKKLTEKQMEKAVAKKEDLEPFDYEKVFAPPNDEELKALGITGTLIGEETTDIPEEDLSEVFK